MAGLGEFEQLVLLAVLRNGASAFGPEIARDLEESIGRRVTRGALYSTLNRLEQKGLLTWRAETPEADRGGHIRRHFVVSRDGLAALKESRSALLTLWAGLEKTLGGRRG
jgi:DNA-binding PadR family transcriptional regulator